MLFSSDRSGRSVAQSINNLEIKPAETR